MPESNRKSKRGGRRPNQTGRPRNPVGSEREAIDRAREKLRLALPELAELALDLARDPSKPDMVRLRAMEFAADRAGLPRETKVESESASAAASAFVSAIIDTRGNDGL